MGFGVKNFQMCFQKVFRNWVGIHSPTVYQSLQDINPFNVPLFTEGFIIRLAWREFLFYNKSKFLTILTLFLHVIYFVFRVHFKMRVLQNQFLTKKIPNIHVFSFSSQLPLATFRKLDYRNWIIWTEIDVPKIKSNRHILKRGLKYFPLTGYISRFYSFVRSGEWLPCLIFFNAHFIAEKITKT